MTAAKAISHEYDNSPDNVANMTSIQDKINESGEQMTAAKAISHEYDNSPDNVANNVCYKFK